jgi:hypothetical protein
MVSEYPTYLAYAKAYCLAAQIEGQNPPAVIADEGSVGVLTSIGTVRRRFRVAQVLSDSSALVDELDAHGFPRDGGSFLIEGVDMSDFVDDQHVNFPSNIIVTCTSTYTYTTVSGAPRTVHKYKTISGQGIHDAAGYWVADLETRLADLRQTRAARYLDLSSKISMYGAAASKNETAATKLRELQSELERLGTVAQQELRDCKATGDKLQADLKEAKETVAWLRLPPGS